MANLPACKSLHRLMVSVAMHVFIQVLVRQVGEITVFKKVSSNSESKSNVKVRNCRSTQGYKSRQISVAAILALKSLINKKFLQLCSDIEWS